MFATVVHEHNIFKSKVGQIVLYFNFRYDESLWRCVDMTRVKNLPSGVLEKVIKRGTRVLRLALAEVSLKCVLMIGYFQAYYIIGRYPVIQLVRWTHCEST